MLSNSIDINRFCLNFSNLTSSLFILLERKLVALLIFGEHKTWSFNFSFSNLSVFIFVPGCWNRPVVAAVTFSARPWRRRARVASRPTISPSWARPCSAMASTAPTAQPPSYLRAPTSPVMIHTNACLALPMPHPTPQTREITCAAISPSAGDRRSRRCRRRRPPRARPAATAIRRRASLTALPATAASTISQVRALSRARK